MLPYLTNTFGNPHSRTHLYGWESEDAVEAGRAQVAALVGASLWSVRVIQWECAKRRKKHAPACLMNKKFMKHKGGWKAWKACECWSTAVRKSKRGLLTKPGNCVSKPAFMEECRQIVPKFENHWFNERLSPLHKPENAAPCHSRCLAAFSFQKWCLCNGYCQHIDALCLQ
jgi:hypothetical protein